MNIVKLQNELKNVPDQALIGYVQNPTGQVPSYLALSELQRRKEMREKYQAAKPEKTTVAQDLEQQAKPSGLAMLAKNPMPGAPTEQGVAGLPTGDMYQEQNFASGGIVAFADGGDTSIPWYKHMSLFGKDYSLVPPSPEEIVALQDKVSPNPFLGGMPETNSSYVPYNVAASEPQPYPSGNKPIPGSTVVPPKTEVKLKPEVKVPRSTGNVYDLEKVKGIGAYADELKNYLGEDPMRTRLQARMDKMDAAAAKQAEQAPWMALAQAGFGMAAGKSPFALQNIAEGATAGLKSYADAQDKLASLEEKRFNLVADMAKSDRAEKVAVAKYGADSKQAVEERNFKRKLQEQHDNVLMKMNDADNAAALSKAMLANRLDQKDLLKYKNDYRTNHPEYLAWQKKAIEDKGKNVVNTQEFKNASDALLNQLITRDLNQSTGVVPTGAVKFLGYE